MEPITIHKRPSVHDPPLIMGLGGWMDAGSISTGTVGYLRQTLDAERIADIDPLEFYILNFPVSTAPVTIIADGEKTVVRSVNPMEMAAVFRPHAVIQDGLITELSVRQSAFHCAEAANLALFSAEEPHIRWRTYAECMLQVARELSVARLFFVGSVAGTVPHTRPPRLRCSVPSHELKDILVRPGVSFTDYEGPASFVTFLATLCPAHDIEMRSIVVEVPHYPFLEIPTYPAGILAAINLLSELLGLDLDTADLGRASRGVEASLNELMEQNDDFRELVEKLEEAYDHEAAAADEEVLARLIDQIDLGGEGRSA